MLALRSHIVDKFYRTLSNIINRPNVDSKSKEILSIELTSACNVKCVWCFMQTFNKIEKNYMPIEKFEALIANNKKYIKKHFSVAPFLRGEPLIYRNFWDACEILKKNGISNQGIHSNFSMPLDMEALTRANIPITVNLGGITKDVHEAVMINSDFELVVGNLRQAYAAGNKIRVKMNCTKNNVHQYDGLKDFVVSLGGSADLVDEYTTTCPVPSRCSQQELEYFFNHVVSDEVRPFLRFSIEGSPENRTVKYAKTGCNHVGDSIYFNGDYTICCQDQYGDLVVGNVFETSIQEIRESSRYKEMIQAGKSKSLSLCKNCA